MKIYETEKKTVTMQKDIVKELRRVAKEENRNFSNMVETAALTYLKQNYNYAH